MPVRVLRACAIPFFAAALAFGRPAPAVAQESFVVIVNAANPVSSLTRAQVSEIFMKRLTEWPGGGGAVRPVDLPAVSPVRDAFSRAVHGRPGSAVASFWGQQLFSGRGTPPPQRPTDRAVVEFVRGEAGAIAYVSAAGVPPDVKVLRVQ